MEEKIMYSLNLTESEFTKVKDALGALTNIVKNSYVQPRLLFPPYKPSPEFEDLCQRILSGKSALVEYKDRKDETELESYANAGKKSEMDKKPDEKQFNDEIQVIHFNESPTLEAIKLLYETHPECVNIDFEELSKVKELSPDLQLLFKDSLKWDVVIHNTFNIEESILSELLRNMSKQDVSFICSNHNISDNFIEHYPELIDWSALLTFNRTPSEKTLFKCFRYIPKRYKKTAYNQLICKQIFENSKRSEDEE